MHLTGGYAVKLTSKQNSSSPISKSSLESVIFINPFSGIKNGRKDVLERLDFREVILTSLCFSFGLSQAKILSHHKRHPLNQNTIMLQNNIKYCYCVQLQTDDLSLMKLHIWSDQSTSKIV